MFEASAEANQELLISWHSTYAGGATEIRRIEIQCVGTLLQKFCNMRAMQRLLTRKVSAAGET